MLYENTLLKSLDIAFKDCIERSDAKRQAILQDFAVYYQNDYLSIIEILKEETLNNPFSKETLEKIHWQHTDIIQKVLARLSSGIYKDRPVREIMNQITATKKLEKYLNEIRYNAKVKETFRRALFFNIALVQPVWDLQTEKIRLDIINPNDIKVYTKTNYNEIEKILIRKADKDGNIYFSVWTDSEHYILQGEDIFSADGNEDMINPYGQLPFSVLRIKEGIDFYGEPNWSLYLNQKYLDIRTTDLNKSELEQIFNMWLGINTNFDKDVTLTPNTIKQVNGVTAEDIPPSLESITNNVDYVSVRENIDWRLQTLYTSEGLSAGSGNAEISDQSGVSKIIDENELYEKREDYKEVLYDFEIDLLQKIRMVANYHNEKSIGEGDFNITFSEEKPTESISDKIARREMESGYGYKTAVTFAMEDLEISESDAIELIKHNKEVMKELNMDSEKSEDEVKNEVKPEEETEEETE